MAVLGGIIFCFSDARADLIVFKNSGYLTGEIVEETAGILRISTGPGSIISVLRQDVDYISSDKNDAPAKEYLNRLKAMGNADARGHERLGAYCFENKLYTPAIMEWQKALRYEPDLGKELEPRLKEAVFKEGLEKIRYFFRHGKYAQVKLLAPGIIDAGRGLDLPAEHKELEEMSALAEEKTVDPVIPEPKDDGVQQVEKQADFEMELKALGSGPAVRSLIELITLSRDNINGYISGINQTPVFNSLINACLRGVKVSLSVSGDNIEANVLQLESMGAEIIRIKHRQAWLSYFTIDNKYLWLCSYGIGDDYIIEEKRSAVVSNYLPLAESYDDFYKQIDKQEKQSWLKKTGQQTEKYEFTFENGGCVEVFFGEGAKIRKEIIERIRTAQQNLCFFTPVFNDKILAREIINRYKEGVRVSGAVGPFGKQESLKRFQKKGINVHKVASRDSRVEASVIIIDDRILALSSISLDKEGWRSGRHNLLLVYDRTLAELFSRELNRINGIK